MSYIYFKPDRIWQASSKEKTGIDLGPHFTYFDDKEKRTIGLGVNAGIWQPIGEWKVKYKNKIQIFVSFLKRIL